MEGRQVAIPTTLGQYLDADWSDDYRPILVTHRAGQITATPPVVLGAPDEDSLAALLARVNMDPLLVDLRLWPTDGKLGDASVNPRRGFDAALYVDTTHPYEKALKFWCAASPGLGHFELRGQSQESRLVAKTRRKHNPDRQSVRRPVQRDGG